MALRHVVWVVSFDLTNLVSLLTRSVRCTCYTDLHSMFSLAGLLWEQPQSGWAFGSELTLRNGQKTTRSFQRFQVTCFDNFSRSEINMITRTPKKRGGPQCQNSDISCFEHLPAKFCPSHCDLICQAAWRVSSAIHDPWTEWLPRQPNSHSWHLSKVSKCTGIMTSCHNITMGGKMHTCSATRKQPQFCPDVHLWEASEPIALDVNCYAPCSWCSLTPRTGCLLSSLSRVDARKTEDKCGNQIQQTSKKMVSQH